MRPQAWEFLYFAGQLLYERKSIEAKYRDSQIRYAATSIEVAGESDIIPYIRQRANDAIKLASRLVNLVNNPDAQVRAFGSPGDPGEPGNPEMLAHLAKRWNSAYEEFLDWAARVRGVSAPADFHNLLELLAAYADSPVEQYRQFVDEYVSQVDVIPAALVAGEQVRIELTLTISIPDEITESYMAEIDNLIGKLRRPSDR